MKNAGETRQNGETAVLCARAEELCRRACGEITATDFLTPGEQRIVFEHMAGERRRLFFWGGYTGSERRIAFFMPEWLAPDGDAGIGLFAKEREELFLSKLEELSFSDELYNFICPMILRGSGFEELSHRDWLGALMALGLKRNVLGDIAVNGSDRNTWIFVKKSSAGFIMDELHRAGRDTVSAEAALRLPESFSVLREYQEIHVTVASMRLDGVVKALCGLSREDASKLVARGDVSLNCFEKYETDREVQNGDIISVKGFGKYIVDSTGGRTRKDRLRVSARKYI